MCDVELRLQLMRQLQQLICGDSHKAFLFHIYTAIRVAIVLTQVDDVWELWSAQYGFQTLRIRQRIRSAGGGHGGDAGVAKEGGESR